jgi:hypothetical protein
MLYLRFVKAVMRRVGGPGKGAGTGPGSLPGAVDE